MPHLIDVDVVDASGGDNATRLDRATFPHALRVNNLAELVVQVTGRVRFDRRLRILRVIGHGRAGAQGLGISIKMANIFDSSNEISMDWMRMQNLADLFDRSRGCLQLHGCNVAQGPAGKAYLARLAGLLGVPVRAGIEEQWAGSLFLHGQWREARPNSHGGMTYHVYHGH